MKINVQTKGVIITSRQKSTIEKKIAKMKRYFIHDEPAIVDVVLIDETGPEKGGEDQTVQISATFGKEKIFIEETDNRIMRAFAFSLDRLNRNLRRFHERRIDGHQEVGEARFEKVFGFLRRGKKKRKR